MADLRAPMPYFGGKSRAAALIWERMGDVENWVSPFAGSMAVELARPHEPKIETVNDADGLLCNAWRAIQFQPRETARWADWPVSELDLHARHAWLVAQRTRITRMLRQDPEWCDPKAAGWWIWGASCWIGSGWCYGGRPSLKVPRLTGSQGVHSQGPRLPQQIPQIGDHAYRGVHYQAVSTEGIYAWFAALSQRLRRVRVCCGDWTRIMGPSVIYGNGITGVFLDPPYKLDGRAANLYAEDSTASRCVATEAARWAIEHGDDPRLRICLAGYEGEHEMPAGWECVPWKANGGYGAGNDNKYRERLWFSPHCLRPGRDLGQLTLLGSAR